MGLGRCGLARSERSQKGREDRVSGVGIFSSGDKAEEHDWLPTNVEHEAHSVQGLRATNIA